MDIIGYRNRINAIITPEHLEKKLAQKKDEKAAISNKINELKKAVEEKTSEINSVQRETQKDYSQQEGMILNEFKLACFEELGITNNPKREKLWSTAWEKGHSNGLGEVWCEMQDLVELITE